MTDTNTLLSRLVRETIGTGSATGLEPAIRFLYSIVSYLKKYRERHQNVELMPTIFLFSNTTGLPAAGERVPFFNDGVASPHGKIWYVNAAASSAHPAEGVPTTLREMYTFISSQPETSGLSAVIYDPSVESDKIKWYSDGLGNLGSEEVRSLVSIPITTDLVFGYVDNLYQHRLITPAAIATKGMIWEDSGKKRPTSSAEKQIQSKLIDCLVTAFPHCDIRQEDTTEGGRCDIRILEHDSVEDVFTHWVLLELKVFRSRSETGTPVPAGSVSNQISDGLKQVTTYTRVLKHKEAALCCFDMRDKDDNSVCFNPFQLTATNLAVRMRRWYLHSSSKSYRNTSVVIS